MTSHRRAPVANLPVPKAGRGISLHDVARSPRTGVSALEVYAMPVTPQKPHPAANGYGATPLRGIAEDGRIAPEALASWYRSLCCQPRVMPDMARLGYVSHGLRSVV